MKKKFLILTFFVAANLVGYAQNSLIITAPGGSNRGVALSGIKRITFASGNMNILKTDATVESVLMTDISKMTFGLLSGVEEITSSSSCLLYPALVDSYLFCSGLSADGSHEVHVFALNGQKVFSTRMKGALLQIDLSGLRAGVYLVNVDGVVGKVIKK